MKLTSTYLIGALIYLQAATGDSALLRASSSLAKIPTTKNSYKNSRSLAEEEEESCDRMVTSVEDEATDMVLHMHDQGTLIEYVCNPSVTEMIREAMISPGEYFLEHYNSTSDNVECSLGLFMDTIETIGGILPDNYTNFDTDMCRTLVLQSLSSNGNGRELEPVSVGLAWALIIGVLVVASIVAAVGLPSAIAIPIVAIVRDQNSQEEIEECRENCSTDEFYSVLDFEEDEFNIVLGGNPIYVVEVAGACERGANIQLARQSGSSRQRFRVGADNSVESVHCPGLVFDVEGGEECDDNTNIHLWNYNGGANQQWFLTREDNYIAPGYTCFDNEVVPTIGVADDRITTGGNIELQWFNEGDPGQGLQFMRAPNEDLCQRTNAYVFCNDNFGTHVFNSMYIPEGSVVDVQVLDGNYGTIFLGVVSGGNTAVQSVSSGQYVGGDRGGDQTGDPADLPNFTFGPVSEAGYFAPFTSGPAICHELPNHAYYVDLRFCIREV